MVANVRTMQVLIIFALAVGAVLLLAQISVPGQELDDRSRNVIRQADTVTLSMAHEDSTQPEKTVPRDGLKDQEDNLYAINDSDRDVPDASIGHEAPRVRVSTYVEALCPDSARFIVDYMVEPRFPKSLWDIVDVKYNFWGNVKKGLDGTTNCQHGPPECNLNMLMDCALSQVESNNSHSTPGEPPASFTIVLCLFEAFKQFHGRAEPMTQAAQKCMVAEGIHYGDVEKCLSRGLADPAVTGARDATDSLNPPHTWVPWVTVNGNPINENHLDDASKLAEAVCRAFTGHPRPIGCSGFQFPEERDESAVGVK